MSLFRRPGLRSLSPAQSHRGMRALATAMLAGMAAIFIAATRLTDLHPAWGFVRAFAEAGLAGGIADWFAVTALFRHPLGLPIPHTAIIPRNKDRIGANGRRRRGEVARPPTGYMWASNRSAILPCGSQYPTKHRQPSIPDRRDQQAKTSTYQGLRPRRMQARLRAFSKMTCSLSQWAMLPHVQGDLEHSIHQAEISVRRPAWREISDDAARWNSFLAAAHLDDSLPVWDSMRALLQAAPTGGGLEPGLPPAMEPA